MAPFLPRYQSTQHTSSKDYGRPLEMDTLLRTLETLLTSVIAGAGIATAIAAIWAARVARRQAKLTERSLAEQHERLRLNLERLSLRLNHCPVAAVFEEALHIGSSDRAQCFAYEIHKRLLATCARFSQIALELGESLLYGIEVRRS